MNQLRGYVNCGILIIHHYELDQEMQILSAGFRSFVWTGLSSLWTWSWDADFICWFEKICCSRSFIMMSFIRKCRFYRLLKKICLSSSFIRMSLIRQYRYYLLPKEDLPEKVFHHDELDEEIQILSACLRRFVWARLSSQWAWPGD